MNGKKSPDKDQTLPAQSRLLLYQTEDGRTRVEGHVVDETVWMTQAAMAELFQSSKQNINHHIQSIYQEGKLPPEATVKKYLTVRRERRRK